MDNLIIKINDIFSKEFGADDSVVIFETDAAKLKKYGNAVHRDKDIVYF